MDSVNSFTITGSFDANHMSIKLDKSIAGNGDWRPQNDYALDIGFKPDQADKIALIKNQETVTATGKIVYPDYLKEYDKKYMLEITQIAVTPSALPRLLHGYFEAKLIKWNCIDGMLATCETSDGLRLECYAGSIYERLAELDSRYLIGSYLRFDCTVKWGEIQAFRIKTAEAPSQKIYLLPPSKASQMLSNSAAQSWPQARRRSVSAKLRREVFMRDGYRCRECGSSPDRNHAFLEVDHIIPFSRGGSCAISNLQTLCSECNAGKSDGMPHPATLAAIQSPW